MAKKDEPKEEPKLEETPVEEPQEEPKEPEQPEESAQEEPEAPAEEPKVEEPEEQPEEQEEEPQISRRERLRVQDLLNKYPDLAEKPIKAPNFRDKVQADEETYKTLEDTTRDFGRELLNEAQNRVAYDTWNRFLQTEDKLVKSKYPELDPSNKEKFYPAVADSLNLKYLRTVGYNPGDPEKGVAPTVANPNVSYSDFVDAEMEYANELASMMAEDSRRKIAKQAASTGIRPGGSTPTRMNLNKPPEQMTDEELKAVIAQSGL